MGGGAYRVREAQGGAAAVGEDELEAPLASGGVRVPGHDVPGT